MKKVKRKWDILTEERRNKCIKEIISFFYNERDEEIGVIAAGELLDFFLQQIGPDLHRKGVEDTHAIIKQHFESMDVDLDVLLDK